MNQDNWPFNQRMNHGNYCVMLSQRLSLLDELPLRMKTFKINNFT